MRIKDMTVGKPGRLILAFALPMTLGNICQQLYTIVDAAFVGQFAGIDALAAIGTADWINWLVMGVIWGFTQGFSVLISQRFGAGDDAGLKRAVGASITLTALIALALAILSQAALRPVLLLLETPAEILPDAERYLRILFGALPILGAYNVQAGILRAVGDARTPLIAMLIASAANIALDALFVIGLQWGVVGAAVGTVIAQGASALYCLKVIRHMPAIRFGKAELRPEWQTARRLIALGSPAAAQNTIIGLGGMAVQRVINGFGSIFIAGFTATNKLYGLMEMAATSYGGALAAYAGQNFGARRYGRIRRGIRTGAIMAVCTALCIAGALFLAGRPVLSLFVSGEAERVEAVLDVAQKYLHVMLLGLPILYLLYVYRSALQGMGDTVMPMISGIAELIMRVGAVLLLPRYLGRDGVYFAEIAAWTGAELLLMLTYYHKIHKLPKEEEP